MKINNDAEYKKAVDILTQLYTMNIISCLHPNLCKIMKKIIKATERWEKKRGRYVG